MTLLHTSDSHFDLVVSKTSRIAQNMMANEPACEAEPNELNKLKDEHEKLKVAHTESLKLVEKLKNEMHEAQKVNKKNESAPNDETEDNNLTDINEEQVLLNGKLNGFTREGPQSKPAAKAMFACNICSDNFKTQEQLRKHMDQHTNDGDWNCDDCDYQTNLMQNLKKHMNLAHHKSHTIPGEASHNFPCSYCTTRLTNKTALEEHIKKTHKSFKPCKNLPNCPFGNACLFNHKEISSNTFLCYECGSESTSLGDLMIHRKNNHTMGPCLRFLANSCIYNSKSCWFNHNEKPEQIFTERQNTMNNKNKQQEGFWELPSDPSPPPSTAQPSVFRDPPANLAPPSS